MEHSPLRVLVVDDDRHMLSAVVATAEQLVGMDVATAASTVEALEKLERVDVDCIVCDYGMPGMNGIDFLTAVRSRFGEIPFVLFTGQGDEGVAAEALRAGVTDYVTKEDGWPERLATRLEEIRQFDGNETVPDGRIRELVQSQLAHGLYMIDLDGRILTWNDGAASVTGYTSGEIVGREYSSLFDEADVEAGVPEDLLEAARWRGSVDYEGWRPNGDGHRIYVREHLVSIDREDGTTPLIGAILQDRTDQHRYERQLARQNDRLREFTSIISHDLRNPLGVVSGRIDLARKTGDDEHLRAAEEAIRRMESYVDDLLVLAKQGQLVGQTEQVDLATVARDAWVVASDRDADAVLELAGETTTVSADRARLRELLENLFLNAIEHGSRPVTVTVGPLVDGFYVTDDGPGFDEEARAHAFEHGFTTSEDGTGFGLSIVETICRAHGWDIVLAEADGGARFEVTGVGPSDHTYAVSSGLDRRRADGAND